MDDGFLRVLNFSRQSKLPAGGLDMLRAETIDAIVIHGLFNQAECSKIVGALEVNDVGLEVTEFPKPFKSVFLGRNLNLNSPDLEEYFKASEKFEAAFEKLCLDVDIRIDKRVVEVLEKLDHGRGFAAAPGPNGRKHYFTTFRKHEPGGYIPAHFDNEQSLRPSYAYVASNTIGSILSYVVTLAEAEHGGMLELYDKTIEAESSLGNDDSSAKQDLSNLRSQRLHVPVGGVAIVNSGKRLHRVAPVEGAKPRWTMCSFMAEAKNGTGTFCWG